MVRTFSWRQAATFGYETITRLGQVKAAYKEIDGLVHQFLQQHRNRFSVPITNIVQGREQEVTLTPLQLFTHVITHEYHHKGQILSMSRTLGYTPIDTDIVRFE